MEQGSLEEAEAKLESLESEVPRNEQLVVLRSVLEEKKGHPEEARRLLEAYVRSSFNSPLARANLARLQWQLGDQAKALSTLRLALAQEPNQERSLHFLAALEESRLGFPAAYNSLLGLCQNETAWLPAWVAAGLAGHHGSPEQVSKALNIAARQCPAAFPPSLEELWLLLGKLDELGRRSCWERIRPHCTGPAAEEVDARLHRETPSPEPGPEMPADIFRVTGGIAAGPNLSPPSLALSPVVLIRPESWVDPALASRLGRGWALLLGEALLEHRIVSEMAVAYLPQKGVLQEQQVLSPRQLMDRSTESVRRLVSLYLSQNSQNEFILDLEQYDSLGNYLGHFSTRDPSPQLVFEQACRHLAQSNAGQQEQQPEVEFGFDEALARDTALAFRLCAASKLDLRAFPNPGLSLDLLAEQATVSLRELGCYLRALLDAKTAGFTGAEAQLEMLRPVVRKDPWLLSLLE